MTFVILSEIAARETGGNAVEGSLPSLDDITIKWDRDPSTPWALREAKHPLRSG
jgi:hypothetical protein